MTREARYSEPTVFPAWPNEGDATPVEAGKRYLAGSTDPDKRNALQVAKLLRTLVRVESRQLYRRGRSGEILSGRSVRMYWRSRLSQFLCFPPSPELSPYASSRFRMGSDQK
jgi:hypothetical protein